MDIVGWIILHGVSVLFWVWLIFWGGADRIAHTFIADLLVFWNRRSLSADNIRFFAWIFLIGDVIWFVVGLVSPSVRFY